MNQKDVITHLQIIHTWVSYAREKGMLLGEKEITRIEKWTADAIELLKEQEAKHGHWKVLENCSNAGVYCSECGMKIFESYPMKKKMSQFCGHCGAEMSKDVERL